MNRLEALFARLDEEVDRIGENGFDPIPFVKEYLTERNDFMASKLSANCAAVLQAAASEFDNAEVDETPDKAQEAFDAMFADSSGALAKL